MSDDIIAFWVLSCFYQKHLERMRDLLSDGEGKAQPLIKIMLTSAKYHWKDTSQAIASQDQTKSLTLKPVFMSTRSLSKVREMFPTVFDDFFKPWFEGDIPGRTLTVPAVNITEEKDNYKVELAAPGMNKEDFSIDIEGNMLSISASKEEEKEEQEKRYTRKEYNFSSFSRSFTIPEEVHKEKIEAKYDDGVLSLSLPKSEQAKKSNGHRISVN